MAEKWKNVHDAFVYRGVDGHWYFYGQYFCNGDITADEAYRAAEEISREIELLEENRNVYRRIARIIETGGL